MGASREDGAGSGLSGLVEVLAGLACGQFDEPVSLPDEDSVACDEYEAWVAVELLRQDLDEMLREKSEALSAVRAWSAQLESILDCLPNAIILRDYEDLRILRANRAAERLLGEPRSAVVGKLVGRLLGSDPEVPCDPQQPGQPSDHPEPEPELERFSTATGDHLVHVWRAPVPAMPGRPGSLLTIIRDMTEYERQRSALRAQLDRLDIYRLVVERLGQAGVGLDAISSSIRPLVDRGFADGYAVLMISHEEGSLQASDFFHVDPEAAAAMREMLGRGARRMGSEALTGVFADGKPIVAPVVTQELRALMSEEARVLVDEGWMTSFVYCPLMSGGELAGILMVMRSEGSPAFRDDDVEAIHHIVDRLAAAVGVARQYEARMLAQEELAHANQELGRSNRDLEEFCRVVAHDLTEPARAVVAFTGLLARRNEDLDERSKEYMARATNAARRMQALIHSLFEYSRATRSTLGFKEVPVSEIVREVLDDLSDHVNKRSADVTVDELPPVIGDRTQIRQLFANLIGNSLKFAGGRRPEIRISGSTAGGEDLVEFTVADNGMGFDPRFADRVFAMFQRADGRSPYSGTGIGLAICKSVVERHGGRIWAETEPGKGTAIRFTLRRAS